MRFPWTHRAQMFELSVQDAVGDTTSYVYDSLNKIIPEAEDVYGRYRGKG